MDYIEDTHSAAPTPDEASDPSVPTPCDPAITDDHKAKLEALHRKFGKQPGAPSETTDPALSAESIAPPDAETSPGSGSESGQPDENPAPDTMRSMERLAEELPREEDITMTAKKEAPPPDPEETHSPQAEASSPAPVEQPTHPSRGPGKSSPPAEEKTGGSDAPTPQKPPKTFVDCLPEWLQEIARGAGSHPELIAATMFQATSCIAAKTYVGIGGKGSRKHHTNLYTLTLTPPAGGKSTVLDTIFAPARKLERVTMKKVEKKRLKIEARITRLKLEIKRLTKKVREMLDELAANEEINQQTRIIAKKQQKVAMLAEESLWLGNLIVNDVTPAGIKQELDIAPDNYNAFVQPDAREFLAILSKERKDPKAGAVRQFKLHLFSGDPIIISRGSGKRRRHLPEPRISLTLMAQTDIGLGFIATAENVQSGLLSRFLILNFPEATKPPRTLPPHLAQRWHSVLEEIYRRKRDQSAPIELHLDHEADCRLREIGNNYRQQADGQTLAIASAMNRAGEQIGRLAVVRALLRLASTGKLKSCASPTVILEDVQAAICFFRLCLDMLKQSLDTVWRERTADPDVVKLTRLLKRNNGAMRLDSLPDHGTKGKKARELADELPDIFGIRKVQTGKKGRPAHEVYLKNHEPD